MLSHHDDIITSYQKLSANLRKRLQDVAYGNHSCYSEVNFREWLHKLGKDVSDIFDSLDLFEKKLARWKGFKDEVKMSNKILQIKLKEVHLDSAIKNGCIEHFKEKLCAQYMQIELLNEHNKKLNDALDSTRERWYQKENNKLICEIIRNREIPQQQLKTFRTPNAELKEIKQSYFDNARISTTEKESMLDKYYNSKQYYYEPNYSIKKLHLVKLTKMDDQSVSTINSMPNFKVNAELEARCSVFEKSINQSNSVIEAFENLKNQLCEKLIVSTESGKTKNKQILQLMNNIDTLKMELLRQRHEVETREDIILRINTKFSKVKNIQETLTSALKDKEEIILSLKREQGMLVEENKRYRSLEFDDKRKIQQLSDTLKNLEFKKQEMLAAHYEELCECTNKIKVTDNEILELKSKLNHLENKVMTFETRNLLQVNAIRNLNNEMEEKNKLISNMNQVENTIKKNYEERYQSESNILTKLEEINKMCPLSSETQFDDSNKTEEIYGLLENIANNIIHMRSTIQRIKNLSRKLKQLQLRCSKISVISFESTEMLSHLNISQLLTDAENLKILVDVRRQEQIKQQKRFEKHKRFLLDRVKEYRKSYIATEKQNEYLLNMNNISISKCSVKTLEMDTMGNGKEKIQGLLEKINFLKVDQQRTLCLKSSKEYDEIHSAKNSAVFYGIKERPRIQGETNSVTKEIDNVIEDEPLNHLTRSDHLLEQALKKINIIQNQNNLLNSHLQQNIVIINALKKERSHLQDRLKHKEELFGKFFIAFRQKIASAVDEANDKFFFQRICSDLKSALKVYMSENKILRNVLESRKIGIITVVDHKEEQSQQSRISTEHNKRISALLEQQKEFSSIKESFSDIQCYLDSMKHEMSFLQAIVAKKCLG